MRKMFLFSILASGLFNAQILEYYPKGQDDYKGGNVQFYKDFHKILVEKNLKPCDNNKESYSFQVVVYPDDTIKYVKEENEEYLSKNKCAYDLSREVAKYLKGWKSAEVDGKKVAARTSFWIIPDELFRELKEGYDPVKDYKMPEYEGGINNFRQKVANSIDLSRFKLNGMLKVQVIFVVNLDGKISEVQLDESSGLKEFDDMIIKSISKIKNKWTPGSIHEIPVRSRFRLPLAFRLENF